MLRAIFVCHFFALITEIFLEKRVHYDFLSSRMSCHFPSELVGPTSRGISVVGVYGLGVLVIAVE
jgi:hypothetical protein